MPEISLSLPIKTVSLLNRREHWAIRAKRTKMHRQAACVLVKNAIRGKSINPPIEVVMIRCGIRKMDDDNVRGALKAVRDGIADALGIDDADPRVQYRYEQTNGKYAVFIKIRWRHEN